MKKRTKTVKAWAVLLEKQGGVHLQHDSIRRKKRELFASKYGDHYWHKIPCTITYSLPIKTKRKWK